MKVLLLFIPLVCFTRLITLGFVVKSECYFHLESSMRDGCAGAKPSNETCWKEKCALSVLYSSVAILWLSLSLQRIKMSTDFRKTLCRNLNCNFKLMNLFSLFLMLFTVVLLIFMMLLLLQHNSRKPFSY